MESQKCMKCPENLYYDSKNHVCNKEINVTNVDHLFNYIENGTYTKDYAKKQV